MEMLFDWWHGATPFLQLTVTIGVLAAALQVAYAMVFFIRVVLWKAPSTAQRNLGVSVVICARNEERNLRTLIPVLMEQNYPDFEVVVVDDSSFDGTLDTLQTHAVNFKRLRIVRLDEDKQRMTGKKFALTVGIKAAQKDIVLLTDADCVPASNDWIAHMVDPLADERIDVVLGVSPYRRMTGLLNRIIRFDAAHIAVNYLSFSLAGIPYMGVGRNLAYRRSVFFKNGGFKSHLHLASGDDDLFVAEVARKSNTAIVALPEAQTLSHPKASWSAWMHQKRRHFTTAPFYRLQIKLLLALWPLSFYLMWLSVIALMIVHNEFLIAGGLLVLRYSVHLVTFIVAFKKTGHSDLIAGAPLWELFVWIINPALWIWNLLAAPRTWK